ncbi:MAG: LacI family DNA-binding transcriptional regulator [Rhodobacter sp.]|nr:LacI family DNA-binding transcriptional regulator [Rhodobacter sp.]
MPSSPNRRPTVRDVARKAGVSVATVSRALSRPKDLKKETLDHVLKVVRETGYRSNQMAVQLRTGASRTLMVLVSDITNAFYAEFFKGNEDYARSRGYILLIGDTSQNAQSEHDYFGMLSANKADGLLWNVDATPAGLTKAGGVDPLGGHPLVLCNHNAEIDAPTVRIDNDLGGRMVAEHLLNLGHRHFAEVAGPLQHDSIRRRHDGFAATLEQAGLAVPVEWRLGGDLGIETGQEAARQIAAMDRRPTAVFAHNDATAIGLLHTLLKLGLRVPDDISVVGYDDMPYARAMTPELTSVRLPRRRWGAAAAKMLISVLEGDGTSDHQIAIPPEFKPRNSSAAPRPD